MLILSSLLSRAYAGEGDLPRIADLINTCATVDQLEIETSVNELQQEFTEPDFDLMQDLQLWCDSENNLIGFGQLRISPSNQSDENSSYLWFRVHPTARNSDIESQIVAWGLRRVQELGKERQTRTKLCTVVRDSEPDRSTFLQRNGFVAERVFYRMERSLLQSSFKPQLLAGFTLRQIEGEHEAEAWVEMFNQTFIDHWDFHPMTIEQWHHYGKDPNYRPENDLVAVDRTGTLAAFCYCEIRQEQNDRTGRSEGWVNVLGTRRGFRGLGLGRAMLLAGLDQLKQSGAETAFLGVDSENPSGALQLYKSVGFSQRDSTTTFAKSLSRC